MSTSPKLLGKYELRERLGRGGMAEVWKAFDTQLERYVAIKILHADLQADPEFITRFTREARVIASLHHPNIMQIHDFQVTRSSDSSTPTAYMVMDYVEGQTLGDYIRSTSRMGNFPLPVDIVHLFASISKAIDYAHHKSMIHRDIKPANILLDMRNVAQNPMGEPILTDFGIAKLMGATTGTLSGFWLGTPLYISPEQAQGHPGNERSDIYSLGVILYEICTGVQPFRGETIAAIMMQHITAMPTSPALINPNIPPALTMVILRCLAKDPAARFSSGASMTAAMAEALNLPVPADLSLPSFPAEAMSGPTLFSPLQSSPLPSPLQGMPSTGGNPFGSAPPSPMLNSMTPNSMPQQQPPASATPKFSTQYNSSLQGIVPANTTPIGSPSDSGSTQNVQTMTPPSKSAPGSKPLEIAPPKARPPKRRGLLIGLIALLIIVLLSSGGGAFYWFTHIQAVPASSIVGHAFFVSSGVVSEHSSQGISDELQIDLPNLTAPAAGKSYYAWLMSDLNNTEGGSVSLGKLTISNGQAQLFYPGDSQHTNLLEHYSQFLVTEEDANITPGTPSLDQSTWRYYSVLPQTPDPTDSTNHFSLLDHLRHLLAEDAKLKKLDLHGGLDIWLFRNTEKVLEWSGSSRDFWEQHDSQGIRNQVIRILDYLDGSTYVQTDVPPGTPNLVNSRIAPVALLEFDQQNQSPPGYLYHIITHLTAVTHAPGATTAQRQLAARINLAMNNVKYWLEQVHTYARQLITTPTSQLLDQNTLSLLDNMEVAARNAFVGRLDPGTNQVQEGVVQIHYEIQRLATFDITPYKPS